MARSTPEVKMPLWILCLTAGMTLLNGGLLQAQPGPADFLAFGLQVPDSSSGGNALIDPQEATIVVPVGTGTDVSAVVSEFLLAGGATTSVMGAPQVSAFTTNNFSSPVSYLVTAADGITTKLWTVSVRFVRFRVQDEPRLVGIRLGSMDAGDFDGDGDLDLLVSGIGPSGPQVTIYENSILDGFQPIRTSLMGLANGDARWGDYDNDGDLDVLTCGLPTSGIPQTRVYTNISSGTFREYPNHGIPGVWKGSLDLGDYDNDGDLDVLVTGTDTEGNAMTRIMRNERLQGFVEVISPVAMGSEKAELVGLLEGKGLWTDFNSDGLTDIYLAGYSGQRQPVSLLYHNNGDTTFSLASEPPGASADGDVSVTDFNQDGRPDLVITGLDPMNRRRALVVRNSASGIFSSIDLPAALGVSKGSLSVGDVDGNGQEDLLLTGNNGNVPVTHLSLNNGGAYTNDALAKLEGVFEGDGILADFDGDDDLDAALCGVTRDNVWVLRVLINLSPLPEESQKPPAPTSLTATLSGDTENVELTWMDASPSPPNPLTYDVYIGQSSLGGASYLNYQITPGEALRSSRRLTSRKGKVYGKSWSIRGLARGTYYWVVQAVDEGLRGSEFSMEATFDVPASLSAEVLSFGLLGLESTADIDTATATISVEIDAGDLSDLTPEFVLGRGAGAEVGGILQISGTGSLDFTSPLTFRVTAENGTTKDWTVTVSVSSSIFQEIGEGELEGIGQGFSDWADIDADGDLDIVLSGIGSQGAITRIYRYSPESGFEDVPLTGDVPGLSESSGAWGDIDQDGDIDLLLSGYDSSMPVTMLLSNNLDRGYERVDFQGENIRMGDVAMIDFDRDGDLDVALSGSGSSKVQGLLYRNSGSGNLLPTRLEIPPRSPGQMLWGDVNLDGVLDLFLHGETVAGIYASSFLLGDEDREVPNEVVTDIPPVRRGAAQMVDIDGDGDLDISLMGLTDSGRGLYLFHAQPGGTFSPQTTPNMEGMTDGDLDWADFDGDGDLDLLIIGFDGTTGISRIYESTGTGLELLATPQLPGMRQGTCRWGDLDGDGDQDILLSGTDAEGTRITRVFVNTLTPAVEVIPAPENLSATTGPGEPILFTWNRPSSYSATLTYDLIIQSTRDDSYLTPVHVNMATGRRTLAEQGRISSEFHSITALPAGNYRWWVQGVTPEGTGSQLPGSQDLVVPASQMTSILDFSLPGQAGQTVIEESASTVLIETLSPPGEVAATFRLSVGATARIGSQVQESGTTLNNFSSPVVVIVTAEDEMSTRTWTVTTAMVSFGFWADNDQSISPARPGDFSFGDYDGDGDLDLVITGSVARNSLSRVYDYTPTGYVENSEIELKETGSGMVEWADIDNDQDLDLVLADAETVWLYENSGSAPFLEGPPRSIANISDPQGSIFDFDNDGDLDILLSGRISSRRTALKLENRGGGNFRKVANSLVPVRKASMDWGDVDLDGDADIILSGASLSQEPSTEVYFNDGDGNFTRSPDRSLLPISPGSVRWGDYNSDAQLDLLIAGNVREMGVSRIYTNAGGTFSELSPSGIDPLMDGAGDWGDYDGDGDLDVVICGTSGAGVATAQLYNNMNSLFRPVAEGNLTGVTQCQVSFVDADTDGDFDIFLRGSSPEGEISRVYLNFSDTPPPTPTAPTGLSLVGDPKEGKAVLRWSPGTAGTIPVLSLHYDILIEDTSDGSLITTPFANPETGARTVPRIGSIRGTRWTIKGLRVGMYEWRVQTVTPGGVASPFSEPETFSMNNSRPTDISLLNDTVLEEEPIGTLVGLLETQDVNNDEHTYHIRATQGNDFHQYFSISGDMLLTARVLDFETRRSFDIRIESDDGQGATVSRTFVIIVIDFDETTVVPLGSDDTPRMERIRVFPNPTSGVITLEVKSGCADFLVATVTGKVIDSFAVCQSEIQILIEGPAGIYLMISRVEGRLYGIEKIVKL